MVDTWFGAPRAVRDSAELLAARAERYVYVSSRGVYASPLPVGLDEGARTVEASPDAESTDYARDKRGGEIAVEAAFGERAVLARAGVILGPYEDFGRLPTWLLRLERGGEVLAPGPAEQALRYVDVRDLADWLLGAAAGSGASGGGASGGSVSGPVNLVNPAGHTSTRDLLEAAAAVTGGRAELVWVDPAGIAAADIDWRTELPGWIPASRENLGLLTTDVGLAQATGLRCRPVEQTVADTWAWLLASDRRLPPSPHPDLRLGLDPAKERAVLAAWRRGSDS